MVRIVPCILLLLVAALPTMAQSEQLSNWRSGWLVLSANKAAYQLDSLTLVPASLEVRHPEDNYLIDSTHYSFANNRLTWHPPMSSNLALLKRLKVRYRVLPYDLSKSYARLDTTKIGLGDNGDYIAFDYNPYDPNEGIIDFKGLDYNGSFARGISFGNSQNLVLNSSFNLRLAGELGDGIEILAAITDNNIPLQPEGNTQQLQEFDKIFIQLKKDKNMLIAGDYELGRPNSYFMNYYKKLQGATYSNEWSNLGKGILKTRASVAVARGKFARNTLPVVEGNQGPYKLQGRDGERFIIALAGTEKVFIDGQLMKRGIEEDYIIDYNRADISFTNKRLITKDSRVIVEFEYADQQFLRSMYALSTEYQMEKLRLHFNFFSEQDSKNSGGAQDLDSTSQNILAAIGDEVNNAFAPAIDTLEEFNEFRIAYKMVDTFAIIKGDTILYQILVNTTNPDSARFTATFTNIGPGQGDYLLNPITSANGRVFTWIAPDADGNSRGDYQPVVRLIAPNQQQLMTLGADYQISKNAKVSTEIAMSKNDANRFSKVGDEDDRGLAFTTNYQHNFPLKKDWTIQTKVNYEFTQDRFQALNPYRNAEFVRDWNLSGLPNTVLQLEQANEHIAKGGLTIQQKKWGSLQYEYSLFQRGSIYDGNKHFTQFRLKQKGFEVDAQLNWLQTDSDRENTRFFRPKIELSKTFEQLNRWKIGVYGEREKNSRFDPGLDTLNQTSFFYDLYRVYLQSPEEGKFGLGASYTQRYDYVPVDRAFQQNTLADEFNLNGRWGSGKRSQLKWNVTYRQLKIIDDQLTTLDPQNSILGRLDHSLILFKGAVRSNTNYEIGSGQEPKIEYQYLPVTSGEGVFFWDASLDANGDGVPQVNEIRDAAFQGEGNITRITIFTDEFIRTNNVVLNESLRFDPRRLWGRKKGLRKFFSKWSTQSTLRINRRTREAEGVAAWNPFQLSVADSALVSIGSNIRNVVYFNRAHPKFDLQVGQGDNWNKIVLTSGFQSRRLSEQFFRGRWNINKKVSSQINLTRGAQLSDSEFFENQDFDIQFLRLEPKLTLLPTKNFRAILSYEFQDSQNKLGEERAQQHDFSLEATYNRTSTTSVRLNFSFAKIAYQGSTNSPVEFAMLEGLKDGQNYLWSLMLDRRLSRNIQMSISYEGRKTGTANLVNVGRAQVRATF
ncbi:MAG: hypothetical protein AAF985_02680 [Bacteroidota bacterium]